MAMPYAFLDGGSFTLAGSPVLGVNVQVYGNPQYVICKSLPTYASGSGAGSGWGTKSYAASIQWEWEQTLGNGYAYGILQGSSGATPQAPPLTSLKLPLLGNVGLDAISTYNTFAPPTFGTLAATAITTNTGGPSWVVSMTNTGTIAVGDTVRLINPTGNAQIGGYSFQVTAVTANTSITLGYAAGSGLSLATDTTTTTVLKYIRGRFYPRELRVLNVTLGASTTIYFGQPNDYTVGENVYIRIPTVTTTANGGWGAQQLNNQVGTVTAVTNSATVSSIVVNINSSGYSSFAFPTNAAMLAGISPAVVGPSSSGVVPNQQPPGTNLLDTFDNRNVNVVRFGAALFNQANFLSTAGDVWMWQCFGYDSYSNATITL